MSHPSQHRTIHRPSYPQTHHNTLQLDCTIFRLHITENYTNSPMKTVKWHLLCTSLETRDASNIHFVLTLVPNSVLSNLRVLDKTVNWKSRQVIEPSAEYYQLQTTSDLLTAATIPWFQKNRALYSWPSLAKYWSIFKILSPADSAVIAQWTDHYRSHRILNALLHYLS